MKDQGPGDALATFHEQVLGVLESLVPKKPENPRIRRMKIQKLRRKLWKKLSKVEDRLASSCTLQNRSKLLQKKWDLQRQLSEDYLASSRIEEDEAEPQSILLFLQIQI